MLIRPTTYSPTSQYYTCCESLLHLLRVTVTPAVIHCHTCYESLLHLLDNLERGEDFGLSEWTAWTRCGEAVDVVDFWGFGLGRGGGGELKCKTHSEVAAKWSHGETFVATEVERSLAGLPPSGQWLQPVPPGEFCRHLSNCEDISHVRVVQYPAHPVLCGNEVTAGSLDLGKGGERRKPGQASYAHLVEFFNSFSKEELKGGKGEKKKKKPLAVVDQAEDEIVCEINMAGITAMCERESAGCRAKMASHS
ncbi:hypothetical protein Btru_036118 [Bulinus truncatus]|nr:hypothetical protein Btru_036118 [Bulinus truncatus]